MQIRHQYSQNFSNQGRNRTWALGRLLTHTESGTRVERNEKAFLRTDHRQAQLRLKWIEIPTPVQKRMPLLNAKRGNPAIDCFAHRVAPLPKAPEIPRRGDRQVRAARLENLEPAKFAQYSAKRDVIANPLQNLFGLRP